LFLDYETTELEPLIETEPRLRAVAVDTAHLDVRRVVRTTAPDRHLVIEASCSFWCVLASAVRAAFRSEIAPRDALDNSLRERRKTALFLTAR
jgi:hypothetical protein